MSHDDAVALLRSERLVAILRRVPAQRLLPVARALYDGGVRAIECTFDHDAPGFVEDACAKIAALRDAFGDCLLVGCGTAMTCEEVDAAVGAGAGMVVSPHADPAVIAHTRALGAVSLPGALTPTEIAAAHRAGADFVKLFPAGEMGLGYVRAVRAPLAHIPLFVVGGVRPQDVAAFLDAGVAGFGVGGPLVPAAAVQAGDYAAIRARAEAFTGAIRAWEAAR